MGYWNTNAEGQSFVQGGLLVWGDYPADILDDALRGHLLWRHKCAGEWLSEDAVEDHGKLAIDGAGDAPSLIEAFGQAREAFRQDLGRTPTGEELLAGWRFALHGVYVDGELDFI